MSEKNLSSRIINKHDTEVNWNKATNFIPKAGEIIVYDRDETYDYERFKIGDGETTVMDLPIINNAVPTTTTDDNDKILMVVNGVPAWVAITNAEGVRY